MKETIKLIRTDKIIKGALYSALLVLLLQIIELFVMYRALPPLLPLFNQMPWGEDRLGMKMEIFLPTIIVGSFVLLNIFLITKLYERLPLLSRIIGITTLLISLLSLIFTIRTVYLIV